jgi:hypothetical protein
VIDNAELIAEARRQGVVLRLDGDEVTAKHAPKALLSRLRAAKALIREQLLREQVLIDRRVESRMADYPADLCFACKQRVQVGESFIDWRAGDVSARFHQTCLPEWRAAQAEEARRSLGFGP